MPSMKDFEGHYRMDSSNRYSLRIFAVSDGFTTDPCARGMEACRHLSGTRTSSDSWQPMHKPESPTNSAPGK